VKIQPQFSSRAFSTPWNKPSCQTMFTVHLFIFVFDMILTSTHISEYSMNVYLPEVKDFWLVGDATLPCKNCPLQREMQDFNRSIKRIVWIRQSKEFDSLIKSWVMTRSHFTSKM
jgi:hypothetical protein